MSKGQCPICGNPFTKSKKGEIVEKQSWVFYSVMEKKKRTSIIGYVHPKRRTYEGESGGASVRFALGGLYEKGDWRTGCFNYFI